MRLTINLDDELYAVAKSLARESGVSASAAVNLLLRRALAPPSAAPRAQRGAARSGKAGLPLVRCGRAFTSDDVYRADAEST